MVDINGVGKRAKVLFLYVQKPWQTIRTVKGIEFVIFGFGCVGWSYLFETGDEFERDESVPIATGVLQQESILEDVSVGKVELDLFDDLGRQLGVRHLESRVLNARIGFVAVVLLAAVVRVRHVASTVAANVRRSVVEMLAVLRRGVDVARHDLDHRRRDR